MTCPTCGLKLKSTSLRAINAHSRRAEHKAAEAERGYATTGVEWENELRKPSGRCNSCDGGDPNGCHEHGIKAMREWRARWSA